MDKVLSSGQTYDVLFAPFGFLSDMKFVITGILVGGIYIFRFGASYSEEGAYGQTKKLSDFSLLTLIPGKKYLVAMAKKLLLPFENTSIGIYFKGLYCPPVASERVLGGFFFGKTMITTAIAFYQVDSISLISILAFSAAFDSLTGTYQHTLMNYFHRTLFKNKIFMFLQNLSKRFLLDIVRAEIIMLLLLGSELLSGANQFHIFRNRLVSASYYFNAVIIDKLVEMGTISRNFRSNFVIVASTIGGMLCLLDFAKTSFPNWLPETLVSSIPSYVPGPLSLLMYFNATIFVIMGGLLMISVWVKRAEKSNWKFNKYAYQRLNLMLLKIITLFSF
jgi:hypothetical protein